MSGIGWVGNRGFPAQHVSKSGKRHRYGPRGEGLLMSPPGELVPESKIKHSEQCRRGLEGERSGDRETWHESGREDQQPGRWAEGSGGQIEPKEGMSAEGMAQGRSEGALLCRGPWHSLRAAHSHL